MALEPFRNVPAPDEQSRSPSEAASMDDLAFLKTGGRVRIDLDKRTANVFVGRIPKKFSRPASSINYPCRSFPSTDGVPLGLGLAPGGRIQKPRGQLPVSCMFNDVLANQLAHDLRRRQVPFRADFLEYLLFSRVDE